jgi:hypothetical protein
LQLSVGNVAAILIRNAPIPSTTAHSQSQIADKQIQKNIYPESKRQCVERSVKKFTVNGDTLDRVHGWESRESKVMRDFVLCELEVTTYSWSIAHVSYWTNKRENKTQTQFFPSQATQKTDAIMRERSIQSLLLWP